MKIAYEYRRAYKNIMDLVQEGNIGLMQAVKRYDPYRGVKLSSYAAWWIRAYILRFILNNWRLVKLGTTQAQRKLFFNLNKEKARLSGDGHRAHARPRSPSGSTSREQRSTEMDRRLSPSEMSLDAPVGDTDGRPVARLDMMPDVGDRARHRDGRRASSRQLVQGQARRVPQDARRARTSRSSTSAWSPTIRSRCRSSATSSASRASACASSKRGSPASCATT